MMYSVLSRTGRVIALAAFAVLLTAGSALAQATRIQGRVTNAVTGDPLAGVVITVTGTALSATTDDQGSFVIENVAPGTASLRVSRIGYQVVIVSRQPVAAEGTTVLNFRLRPSVLRLQEIVVTGVAEATQGVKLPFTVDMITSTDIVVVPIGTPEEAIRGKVPGAKIVRANGTPGGGVSVLLRGGTSIDAGGRSNEPLYVVDGVILGSSMVDIDANDIISIEVLKGAAGASLYGARAANGVVNIRTNRGRSMSDGDTRITFKSEVGRNYLGKRVSLTDHHEFRVDPSLGPCLVPTTPIPGAPVTKAGTCWVDDTGALVTRNDREPEDVFGAGGFQDNDYGGALFNHLDLFFNPASFNTQTGTIRHRSGPTNFSSTFARTEEGGIIDGLEGYEQKSVRVNLDHFIGRTFELSVSGYYSNSTSDGNPTAFDGPNPFFGLMFLEPDNDILAPNSDGEPFIIQPDINSVESNPLYETHNTVSELRRSRTLGNFRVRWFPVADFDLEADFSFDRSDRNNFEFLKVGYKTAPDPDAINRGRIERRNDFDQALNASLTARYITRLGEDLGSTTSGRILLERTEFERIDARARDLVVNNTNDLDVGDTDENQISSVSEDVRSLGYFISQDLDYKDRYIISGVLRRDGSSLFGDRERWHTYYRLGAAYRVAQESWWPLAFIEEFKLRFSRGTAGGRPRFSAQYETFAISGGVLNKGVLGNRDLKPEFATENEGGLDMIFGGRVQVSFTYAESKVQDQILEAPLPAFIGFGSKWLNAGTLQSKTFEASLQASLVSTRDFGYDVSVVFDRTRQKITEFDIPAFRWGSSKTIFFNREGEDFGTMYGTRFLTSCGELSGSCDGWQVNDDGWLVPVGSGNSWQDGITGSLWGTTVTIGGEDFAWGIPVAQDSVLADGTTSTDFLRIGNTTPDYNLGFTQSVSWKNFSLYTLIDAQIGGDVYNATRQWSSRDNRHGTDDQFGKSDATKKPISYGQRLYNVNATTNRFVEDAPYVKFRELSLRYSLGARSLQNLFGGFMKRITLAVVGRNLITWTDYTGFDPEVGAGGSNAAIERTDSFNYPNYRTFTGSFEIEF